MYGNFINKQQCNFFGPKAPFLALSTLFFVVGVSLEFLRILIKCFRKPFQKSLQPFIKHFEKWSKIAVLTPQNF